MNDRIEDDPKLTTDEIMEILEKEYGIRDPEHMRAMILYNDGFMPQDEEYNNFRIGVDLDELEIAVNFDIEYEKEHGKSRYNYIRSLNEIVWDNFHDLLKESIRANM